MKYLEAYKINSTGYLGTQVDLELLFIEEPTSIVISVFDSNKIEVVEDVAGTKGSIGRYVTYGYQSDDDNIGGKYQFRIKATFTSGYDYIVLDFNLKDYNLD